MITYFFNFMQEWQLKLSGIGVSSENEFIDEGDGDSPIGAFNPLLIKDGEYLQCPLCFF